MGTRKIGLSLGADICWPLCYEGLLRRLDLSLPVEGETVRFEVERVAIEPFDLQSRCPYDLVIDRLTHWYSVRREWIKKAVVMDDLYVFNNPWSVQSMEKHTTYCAMMRLGLPIPRTWLVPPKDYEQVPDLERTLRYARLFDLGSIGTDLGYPLFMKPYDGGGWVGVTRVDDEKALRSAYEGSGRRVMHLQAGVKDYEKFVRCVGLGPQCRFIAYDPSAPLHDRYRMDPEPVTPEEASVLKDMTLTINTFFGWDFNSCEGLLAGGTWYPIDYANPCPDSQVTSLHFHFPWLILANLRWSLFCTATRRPMRKNLDWRPYFEVADRKLPFEDSLKAYAGIAHERLDTARFEEFCERHLGHLQEVALEFFGTDEAREAVRKKVEALYPAHEVAEFTELFWTRIQDWRDRERTPAQARNHG